MRQSLVPEWEFKQNSGYWPRVWGDPGDQASGSFKVKNTLARSNINVDAKPHKGGGVCNTVLGAKLDETGFDTGGTVGVYENKLQGNLEVWLMVEVEVCSTFSKGGAIASFGYKDEKLGARVIWDIRRPPFQNAAKDNDKCLAKKDERWVAVKLGDKARLIAFVNFTISASGFTGSGWGEAKLSIMGYRRPGGVTLLPSGVPAECPKK